LESLSSAYNHPVGLGNSPSWFLSAFHLFGGTDPPGGVEAFT
jgi:hypothetical protein